jgi:hypothetical protein
VLLDAAVEFFEASDWVAERHPEDQMLRATFEGQNGPFTCYAIGYDDQDRLGFYAVLPGEVADGHRNEVALLLSMLNYGLVIGNFEIDHGSGEVRFRAGIDVEGGVLTATMVKSMASMACLSLDFYRAAIEAVASGAISPADAYVALEDAEPGSG